MNACKRRNHCRRVGYEAGFKRPQEGWVGASALNAQNVNTQVNTKIYMKSLRVKKGHGRRSAKVNVGLQLGLFLGEDGIFCCNNLRSNPFVINICIYVCVILRTK